MTEKAWTLRDHEVRQLLSAGECLVVRPVKPQPWWIESPHMEGDKWVGAYSKDTDITNPTYQARCPYPVGSRWWAREKWRIEDEWESGGPWLSIHYETGTLEDIREAVASMRENQERQERFW